MSKSNLKEDLKAKIDKLTGLTSAEIIPLNRVLDALIAGKTFYSVAIFKDKPKPIPIILQPIVELMKPIAEILAKTEPDPTPDATVQEKLEIVKEVKSIVNDKKAALEKEVAELEIKKAELAKLQTSEV